jgi:hypothetical protein
LLDRWSRLRAVEAEAGAALLPHTWDATSDSVALVLAGQLGARELHLLKSVGPAGPLDAGGAHPRDERLDFERCRADEENAQSLFLGVRIQDVDATMIAKRPRRHHFQHFIVRRRAIGSRAVSKIVLFGEERNPRRQRENVNVVAAVQAVALFASKATPKSFMAGPSSGRMAKR